MRWKPPGPRQGGPKATTSSSTDEEPGEDPPAVLSLTATHEQSDWERPPVLARGRIGGQSQRLEDEQPAEQQQRLNPDIADALLAAAFVWTKSGSVQKIPSWTTEDVMPMMAGGPVENKGKSNVRICRVVY